MRGGQEACQLGRPPTACLHIAASLNPTACMLQLSETVRSDRWRMQRQLAPSARSGLYSLPDFMVC
jgi:hypothetical protein